jgi:sugar lactone lactonase YvrE
MKNKLHFLIAGLLLALFIPSRLNAQLINTIAGNGTSGYSGDGGLATAAQLSSMSGVAIDVDGNLFLAEYNNNTIRKVDHSGIITTVAGTGTTGYSGDGGPATAAEVNRPKAVAVDNAGNFYISEDDNNRIRKINSAGIISTIAGNGAATFSGDGGPATSASLNAPAGIAIDASGNIYIADYNNNRVRKVSTSGIISTVAGTGTAGYSGDGGQATAAQLHFPVSVVVDATGNIFIADMYNACIRKVDSKGLITTIAGTGTAGYSGDGASAIHAQLSNPSALALDSYGTLYVADYDNNRIRKISTDNIITTITGNGTPGFTGDGGPASGAEVNLPTGVALSSAGEIYIGDSGNNRVRKISLVTSSAQLQAKARASIYPVPGNGLLTASLPGTGYIGLVVYDAQGRKVFSEQTDSNRIDQNLTIDLSGESTGIYLMQIQTVDGVIMKKVEITK